MNNKDINLIMITNDSHVQVEDTSNTSIMVMTSYTSTLFMIVVHSTIVYLVFKSNS